MPSILMLILEVEVHEDGLDRFRLVNDSLGADVEAANRIRFRVIPLEVVGDG